MQATLNTALSLIRDTFNQEHIDEGFSMLQEMVGSGNMTAAAYLGQAYQLMM